MKWQHPASLNVSTLWLVYNCTYVMLFLLSQIYQIARFSGDKEEKIRDEGQNHSKPRDVYSATHETACFDFYQLALKRPKHQNLSESRWDLSFYEFWVRLSLLTVSVQHICYTAGVFRYSLKFPLVAGISFRDCICVYICVITLLLSGSASLFCSMLLQ